ncbi:T9SS type A sorting domain-containing protein [Aestuariivivens marinum]|uniref:T9SS type A sorting domain-containing protein n=1 Tax=Aestuariivivens marinum TaxID=2913555 RepID=UPI001F567012|nr:T9SS type A sorting domain-containing protein [Aestuariivivens marinum]
MKKITLFFLISFLSITVYAQPVNDDCSGAIELTVDETGACNNIVLSFDGSESDSGVAEPSCGTYSGKDLWYKFVMPNDGAVRIKTSFETGSPIDDVVIAAYSGTCGGTLTEVGCDDDGNPDPFPNQYFAQLDIIEAAASTVYLRIWDYADVGAGSIQICLYKIDAPLVASNDECSSAEILALTGDCSAPLLKTFNQATASSNPDPTCATNEGGDVWFEIQVDNDQAYNLTIETSEDSGSNVIDTGIAVYSGTCGALTEIACDDDSGQNLFSKVDLTSLQGVTLYVRVYPVQLGHTGTFYVCATKSATLGLSDQMLNAFTMFPNPARDVVNLKFTQSSGSKVAIAIYNLQGKLVQAASKTSGNQNVSFPVSHLATGLYFVKLNDGTNEVTKKLMVR